MGSPVTVDPHEAIVHAIAITAGEVAYCDAQISRLSEDELFERPLETTFAELPMSGQVIEVTEKRDAEVLSRWVQLRDNALERLVRFSKIALDAGVEERRVRVAEQVADVIAPLFQNLADDLQLSRAQRDRLPDVIGARMRQLETAAA